MTIRRVMTAARLHEFSAVKKDCATDRLQYISPWWIARAVCLFCDMERSSKLPSRLSIPSTDSDTSVPVTPSPSWRSNFSPRFKFTSISRSITASPIAQFWNSNTKAHDFIDSSEVKCVPSINTLENGPPNDVNQVLHVLISPHATVYDLLEAVSNQLSTKPDNQMQSYHQEIQHELAKQLADYDDFTRQNIKYRLGSAQTAAVIEALKQYGSIAGVEYSGSVCSLLTQLALRLEDMQKYLDIRNPTRKIMLEQYVAANDAVNKFAVKLGNNLVKHSGSAKGDEALKMLDTAAESYVGKNEGLSLWLQGGAHLKMSVKYSDVSDSFVADLCRHGYLLVHPDSKVEWLSHQEMSRDDAAIDRMVNEFKNFCGDKAGIVSRLVNQNLLSYGDFLATQLLRNNILPIPNQENFPELNAKYFTGDKSHAFVIKKNADGTLSMTANNMTYLRSIITGDSSGDLHYLMNRNCSQMRFALRIDIDQEGCPRIANVDYDYKALPFFRPSDEESYQRPKELPLGSHELWRQWLDLGSSLHFTIFPFDSDRAVSLGKDMHQIFWEAAEDTVPKLVSEIAKLFDENKITEGQYKQLCSRVDMLAQSIASLANLGNESSSVERMLSEASHLVSDLRLLQQDLMLKAETWYPQFPKNDAEQVITVLAGLSVAFDCAIAGLQTVVADYSAALDDFHCNIDKSLTGSKLARVEMACMQSAAVAMTLSRIEPSLPEKDAAQTASLRKFLMARHNNLSSNLELCRNGEAVPLSIGSGASGSKGKNAGRRILTDLQDYNDLPVVDPQLTEGQLDMLLVAKLADSSPAMKKAFAGFSRRYAEEFNGQLGANSWATIDNTFTDIGVTDGRSYRIRSKIVPAPSFSERIFADSYNKRGVPCGASMQGAHVRNLAHTAASVENGRTMCAFLRHAVLDAFDVTKENLANVPEGVKSRLLKDTKDRLPNIEGGSVAARLREAANANMAAELVRAAVVSNPLLLDRVRNNKPVTVRMDSISMSAPEMIKPFSGKERQILKNQLRALRALTGPFEISVEGIDGKPHKAAVTVEAVRKFNFPVGESGLSRTIRKLFRPFLSWRKADRMNRRLLTQMLGPLNGEELGGEAEQVLSFLEGRNGHDLDEQRQEELQLTGGLPSVFADPDMRAATIRKLGVQIKQIIAQRSHHSSGDEPYMLAARVALLSSLLGRTTAVNCRNGNDRTGQLDETIKYLAANAAQGALPRVGTVPDPLRRTSFALFTGNLELQQYNTGMRGYRLRNEKTLRAQLASPLAEKLYFGDSLPAIS